MPAPNRVQTRLERLYVTKETTYGTAVSPTATDALRHIKFSARNDTRLLIRRDKTGSRTGVQGAKGRSAGSWSYEGSLYGSGTAATVPDFDVLLQMLFGKAATAGVYTLADTIVSGNLWSFRQPSTADQRAAIGALLNTFTFTLGEDVAEWSCDGPCLGVLGSNEFGTADTELKGGLGSFPAEPGTQTYLDAGLIAGFTGAITIDGQTIVGLRTATIRGTINNQGIMDQFGNYYSAGSQGGEREITFSANCYDDDSAALTTIKEAALSKAAIGAQLIIGTVAGNIFQFDLAGIQLANEELDDAELSYTANFPESPVKGSSPALRDELTLTCG